MSARVSKPTSETAYVAWQFSRAMGSRLEKALAALDLTLAQHNALKHAAESPGLSNADAARGAGITAQSMGVAVNELAGRGLLEQRPHPTNRRKVSLYITDTGRPLLASAQETIDRISAEALTVLTPQEQATLHRLLYRLVTPISPLAPPDSAQQKPAG